MIRRLSPLLALTLAAHAQDKKAYDKANDPFAQEGNPPPSITKLTPEQEAEILKGVTVPEDFDVSLFATASAANYPVFLAAAPNGDLYVASDGNGAQGKAPKRGRVIRLRDTDGDGRADETKVFCEIDSPRGVLWDNDRLYVIHPPHLTAFIDKDGDGVAEESKRLVSDIAFGFPDRPADHTTNGISMGVDGWLYIAGGDFAFIKATGSDGKTLQHRNGGVIRVRPDGSDIQIYATGTRNILEVAISPEMDMFTRDNTNDGGGWNVRFHQFTGIGDHGYPRLYKNFGDEIIQPIADYGGGSGCGAVYIDEPGFGEWNNAPFTADWGTGALWRHSLKIKSAAFTETEPPKPFIKLYRPTDGDVDAMSRVYLASWKGATFNWEGPEVGFIVQVKPKGFTPEPLPDFRKASDADLVKLCESESYRRRIEAQRELMRRGLPDAAVSGLTALAADPAKPIAARAAALLAFTHFPEKGKALSEAIAKLPADPAFDALVARGTAEDADWVAKKHDGSFTIPKGWKNQPSTLVQLNRMISASPAWNRATRKAVFNLTLGNSDTLVRHTAVQALAKMQDHELAFSYLADAAGDTTEPGNTTGGPQHDPESRGRPDALQALARMHKPEVVTGLIGWLGKTKDLEERQGILSALCRLYFHDGEWKGDSWGTRPDTRGPYYQPEAWSETPRVAEALKEALAGAGAEESAFLVKEMNRNRIQSNDALEKVLSLAEKDPKLMPDAAAQLATAETIPVKAIPLLITAANTDPASMEPTAAATLLMNVIISLSKTDSTEGIVACLQTLETLSKVSGARKENEAAQNAFLDSQKLENHHHALEEEAAKVGTPAARWADAALLKLSARKDGTPESRAAATNALDEGWKDTKRRVQILRAVAQLKHNHYADKVLAALDDPDKEVAKVAQNAAKGMKLEKKTAASGPLVGSLKNEEVIKRIMKTKGDAAAGEQIFNRVSCNTCHTTEESQPQKGPYLGNIAQTYKRAELAEAILDPNKTVSQGFATNAITTKDGHSHVGFVTFESAEKVTLRDITGKETNIDAKNIASREKPPISMMPPGLAASLTIKEFAGLLDYLEALSKK
ncbi:hypothetical protein OVA24_07285 [Luteolibacter sp. SL250]|uniref:DUF7133 domain-containing protein n=1 Tax=Luteolibacter sp. SL250 TaxID=2995170 RepID=UPI00226FB773|nr:hypothetical protein [Luteolibacter sp. SL250]WAC21185.1 hypothetical protein OVA24_07285 [Luteolibacter sp. SL250]